jgi:hypothetical protein
MGLGGKDRQFFSKHHIDFKIEVIFIFRTCLFDTRQKILFLYHLTNFETLYKPFFFLK